MLREAWIIKVKPQKNDGGGMFARPGDCYVPISQEGIHLEIYYSRIPFEDMDPDDLDPEDDGNWYDFDFYRSGSNY